jgi:ubiquinone/menaquinone biosynthesis C-methylase UbiE
MKCRPRRVGLDGARWVLGLGSGIGELALPVAKLVDYVTVVDPEPGLLE